MHGTKTIIRFGKIGANGQTQARRNISASLTPQEKEFDSVELAHKHVDKLVAEKLKKGYASAKPTKAAKNKKAAAPVAAPPSVKCSLIPLRSVSL